MLLKTIATSLALIVLPSLIAAETLYKCEIKSHSDIGWIPPKLYLEMNDSRTEARVEDRYVYRRYKHPIAAQLVKRSDVSYAFDWEVEGIPISDSAARISANYRAILNIRTGRVSITAMPKGNDNNPRGSGKCVVQK